MMTAVAVTVCLALALIASILGVAAARKGWWAIAAVAGIDSFLAIYTAMFVALNPWSTL
jgi:hypothetical protein